MPNLTEDWLFKEDKLEPTPCSTCCLAVCTDEPNCHLICPACKDDGFAYHTPKETAHRCADFVSKDASYVSPTQR